MIPRKEPKAKRAQTTKASKTKDFRNKRRSLSHALLHPATPIRRRLLVANGIDLHARTLYLCILDQQGETRLHKNLPARPEPLLKAIAPYREDIVRAVECIFTWYWIADLCADEGIPFVLGHALYMKAIHGGKAKNDQINSAKIAALLRGGMSWLR